MDGLFNGNAVGWGWGTQEGWVRAWERCSKTLSFWLEGGQELGGRRVLDGDGKQHGTEETYTLGKREKGMNR